MERREGLDEFQEWPFSRVVAGHSHKVQLYSDGHQCQKSKTFTTRCKNSMNFGDYSSGYYGYKYRRYAF